MENEFMRITVSDDASASPFLSAHDGLQINCDGNYVVPRNPAGLSKYP